MAQVRDYKAEYLRRIERGLARGLTRAQARGHPEAGKPMASGRARVVAYNRDLEEGVKLIRGGHSLTASAQSIQTTPERLLNYLTGQGVGTKQGGRWRVSDDHRERDIQLFSNGAQHKIRIAGYDNSRLVGEYMNAVKKFLDTNDPSHLEPFKGVVVTDAKGKRFPLETDPNTLYRLYHISDEPFESVYQIVA